MKTLKGKAKIQLINNKNEIVHETIDENVITDAVEKIATLSDRDFLKGLRSHANNIFHFHPQNITPLATELFGGILLFEGQITEDSEINFPPASAKAVGHAGAPYSGENPYRGTYNASESGPLYSGIEPIGYRHVWDFVTDRVNATIGCICLTSRMGGNTGWKSRGGTLTDTDSQIDTYMLGGLSTNSKIFSTASLSRSPYFTSQMFSGASTSYMFYIDDEEGYAYHITNEGKIAKSTFSNSEVLKLDNVPTQLGFSALEEVINTESSYLGRRTFTTFNGETKEFTFVRPKNENTIERKVLSEAGAVKQTEEVILSGATMYSWSNPIVPPFYYKGLYYASILSNGASHIGEFDSTGALIRTFDFLPFGTNQAVVAYLSSIDRIVIKIRVGSPVYDILFDGSTFESFKTADSSSGFFFPVDENKKSPGFYAILNEYNSYVSGSATSLYYKFRTNYLASINNLSAPVTKTASDMMKITYDIFYEES